MCRSYQRRGVPRSVLLRVLEAARKSPSAGHAQGVRLVVADSTPAREQVLCAVGEAAFVERGFPAWFGSAPVHLLVCSDLEAYGARYAESDKTSDPSEWPVSYPVLDGGKALMALYLAAEREGLSCGYLGPHACAGTLQSLLPDPEWTLLGLVSLGYREQASERPSHSHKRGWREFDEVVHWI